MDIVLLPVKSNNLL